MAQNTSRDHPDDLNIRQRWPDTTIPFPPYRGPQAQPHRRGTIVAHVCLRLSVASCLSHSYRMELFVNCVIYNVMPCRAMSCRAVPCRVVSCYVMLCYVMHEQEGVTWEFFPLNPPPPQPDIIPYGKRSPWKKSHGRTSTGEKQYHNYGKASPSMVDHPPPPHTHTHIS